MEQDRSTGTTRSTTSTQMRTSGAGERLGESGTSPRLAQQDRIEGRRETGPRRGYEGRGRSASDRLGYGGMREYGSHARPIDHTLPHRSRTGLYLEDALIVLGIVVGGAAGYVAAASVRDRGPGPGYDGRRREWMNEGRGGASRATYPHDVEHDETTDLIASDKVEGTPVFDNRGEKIGKVRNFMVGKRSGKVSYAVMSFGGFLGIGEQYHPLPWDQLTYHEGRGGYVIDIDKDRLMHAPSHRPSEDAFAKPEYGRRVRDYWSNGRGRA